MAMWLCRAGRYGEYENRFLEDGRIYCTWDNLDLSISSFSKKQDLQQYFIDHFQDVKTKTAMNWASQVYPFGHEMKKGEVVVLPSKIKAVIHFGKITGDYVFDEAATPPFCHYHTVDWYAVDIPRSAFDQDILYSFGAFMTICRIKQEDRIKAQIKASQHGSTQGTTTQPPVDTTSRDIEQDALGDITDLIIQKAKGHGLALKNISFTAKEGETIGIIGGTGSGKSTLVNLIPRFYDAVEGSVYVCGQDVRKCSFEGLRSRIGIVPQKAELFSGTIKSNLLRSKPDATDGEIEKALKISQAYEFVSKAPEGLEMHISSGGKNLSGGQRQRLTIARAVLRSPQILILDDSASALDFATDAALRRALAEQKQGMTVFMVSQRVGTVRYSDKILVLDGGELVGTGTHKELIRSCPVYKEICLSQLRREEVENDVG